MGRFFWHDDFLVVTDKNELLIHDDDVPLWRHVLKDDIVGVSRIEEQVITIDKGRKLRYWNMALGEETQVYALPNEPTGISDVYERRVVVLTTDDVLLYEDGHQLARQPLKSPVAAAFSADGSLIAVASTNGLCTVYDGDLEFIESVETNEAPARDILWNPGGYWQMATGKAVHRIYARAEKATRTTISKGEIMAVACSPDGLRFAIIVDGNRVIMMKIQSRDFLARVTIEDKPIIDLEIPNDEFMTLALDKGSANKVSLVQHGLVWCNDRHPEREPDSWNVRTAFAVPKKAEPEAKKPTPPKSAPPTSTTAAKSANAAIATPEKEKPSLVRRGCRIVMWIIFAFSALIVLLTILGAVAG